MNWIAEQVDQLARRHDRLSRRPLDAELLETLDELDARMAYFQRLERVRGLPRRPARIPTDAVGLFARVARSFREDHGQVALELVRPSGLRRALLDGPAVELAARCWLELLRSSSSCQRIAMALSVVEDGVCVEVSIDAASPPDLQAHGPEVAIVREGLARAGLEWEADTVHRLRSRDPEEPITGRYVFPPPDGAAW